MLTFADAKRIIDTTEKHEACTAFAKLYRELFTMLEENTADQLLDMENRAKEHEYQCRELKCRCEKLETELAELNKKYKEAITRLQKAVHTIDLLDSTAPKKKPGRPKKPESAKAETYESDLADLNEAFGVHELAKDIFGGEE